MADDETGSHPFDTDTEVVPTDTADGRDGVFAGRFTDRWNALGGVVNGGYYVGVALQALRQVLQGADPVAVSTFFLRGGFPGPVEVHTEVARQGRRLSTGTARIVQDGRELSRTTATFSDLSRIDRTDGLEAHFATAPDLPSPGIAIDPLAGRSLPGVTITEQVEYRFASLPGWRQGRPDGEPRAEFWMRFLGGRDADTMALPLLVDAAAPVVLDLGVAGSVTVEMTTHVRRRPAPGWLACRVATTHVGGGYHEEDFDIWDETGALVAQSRQLALLIPG